MATHHLSSLHGESVGPYRMEIEFAALRSRKGWTRFSCHLKDQKGNVSSQRGPNREWIPTPVLQGIHSPGGRGVKGWIEVVEYHPVIHFQGRGDFSDGVSLSEGRLDQKIFNLLSRVIPPGGHLMFVYEVSYESSFHRETEEGLRRGIPPISTPQGALLFHSGCRWVKNWYLSEGGHEGLRKLWAEKPLNEKELLRFDLLNFLQLLSLFCRKPNQEFLELELRARKRAFDVLFHLKLEPNLSSLREKLRLIWREGLRQEAIEAAARNCCRLIKDFGTSYFNNIGIEDELNRILRQCSEASL